MNLEYKEQDKAKTLNEVCGVDAKAFERYMEAKNAFLEKRDEKSIKRIMESVSWQMGRVA